ncbi:M23 family metallopeptidase [Caballeronia sp. GAFFF2]|uniref:M23 family metallopeptidase n=1 Tax=Caballeronia sp. GAFFF2 TaxID=2921741 RepID=UPI0020286A72|nr:M23 family metallopeptidase [Caballeronia sp. GAFFF2]
MIISPPFLPAEGLTVPAEKWKTDPMMDVVDKFELTYSGVFPIASDRRWHCGMHLVPDCGLGQKEPVRAIADGEVVAYRVAQNAVSDGQKKSDGTNALNSNTSFVLLKHTTDTGEGRTITFYSLYMHLLDLVSMQGLVPQLQPSQAPQNSSPNALPAWLLAETEGVQPGGSKKVYRKDQLGYVGKYHNETHLHFEIFMTEADFTAWFEQNGHKVALGESHPETPASKDYWGHTYFVIPEKSAFVSVPPGMASLNTGGHTPKPFFPALNEGVLGDGNTLYVQTYFSRGERFMRAWIDRGDGTLVALTPDEPIKDKFDEYEYQLYERATKLYGTCPSDGYEMLRFGRILSTDTPSLSAEAQATWLAVPFDQGKVGYINVNQQTVKTLSDADFPFFMDWQKIEDGNTPFDQAGLCGYDELCRITGVSDLQSPDAATLQEFSKEESLKSYVQGQAAVRAKLKGFICHAKSEWDASNNEARYGGLKEPEGFFGKRKDLDPDGYTRFIEFVEQSQFMGQVQVQSGEDNKLWFFHPLAFIRHFRKGGWLSANEFKRIYSDNHYPRNVRPSGEELRSTYLTPLNLATRKFVLATPSRLAHFLGQGAVESAWLMSMQETSMLGTVTAGALHGAAINPASKISESDLGHWYGQVPSEEDLWFKSEKFNSHGGRVAGSYDWKNGNCDKDDAQKFRGRGFKQLTGRSNYASYWLFRGWITRSSFTDSWWNDAAFRRHDRNGMTKTPANIEDPHRVAFIENCIDSGAFYIRVERPKVVQEIDRDTLRAASNDQERNSEREISRAVTYAINGGYIDDARRLEYTHAAKEIICD